MSKEQPIEYEEVEGSSPRTLRIKKQATPREKGEVFYIEGVPYVQANDGQVREQHVARSEKLQDSLDKKDAAARLKALEEKE